MTYIENVFLCLATPLILSLFFTSGRARRFMLFVTVGMTVCLLSAYVSSFFAGYYGAVIQRYLEIEPRARLFFVTMPREWNDDERRARLKKEHAELLYKLTEVFPRSYVIDLHKYAPVYDDEFAEKFYMDGHLNPMGYLLTGQMMCSYIDYIVRNNFDDFRQVGFVGTSLVNKKYKD